MPIRFLTPMISLMVLLAALLTLNDPSSQIVSTAQADEHSATKTYDPTALAVDEISKMKVGKNDWPQWFGWSHKNNTPDAKDLPVKWDVEAGENILWSAKLGSQTYGNPVVANGKVMVGTNNGAGYLSRYPESVDLGCLICFDEKTGKFLWQASSTKLPTGRVHDWPLMGVCCSPYIEGDRCWYVTSRGEVACLDIEGFHDGQNDGHYVTEPNQNKDEADYIWLFDMMGELNTSQHNMCSCSVTCMGDYLFVNTSNGVDESHINIPSPNAPSFIVMDKNTGYVLWKDKSPGENIHHGQWSSPAYAEIAGKKQLLFAGGDGWLYSFAPEGDGQGKPKLYWKVDCNPKETLLELGGRGTRNDLIATPVIYDGLVYITTGQDPEHGEGVGNLWCIDPSKEGNVSPTLAVDKNGKELPHRRILAVDAAAGEKAIPNPNSAIVWKYASFDQDGNGKLEFEETMHRSIGSAAIKDNILYIADFSGLVHCLDAKTGKPFCRSHDMFAQCWGSPLIADGKVYIGDEDGEVTIFAHGKELKILAELDMQSSVYSSPICANNTLFIANKSTLFAIGKKK